MDHPRSEGLYDELAPFYRLLDATEEHEHEVAEYVQLFERSIRGEARSLLELGAGAGNNAFYLRRRFECALLERSDAMIALSRALNPQCEHVSGDMRSARLGRSFDAVLVHDAICYMRTEDDLLAALRTAHAHLRDGGVALFVPDCVRESFFEHTDEHGADAADGRRGLRAVEWMWDPDPSDTTYTVDYAFLLRDERGVRAVHDRHIEGLFAIDTWRALIERAGFRCSLVKRSLGEDGGRSPYTDTAFLATR